MLTIGSLFSGIGGLELGLEWAGLGPVVFQCESDPFCRAVLAKHWPNAARYDDVRTLDASVPRVDVLCGGFPCQDISFAGDGAGIDGERSGLWREFARVIGLLRPTYVVVENVGALLVRGMGRVLGDLCALGYDAEWSTVRASDVGAPHRRERVFIVAHARCGGGGERGVRTSASRLVGDPDVAGLEERSRERGDDGAQRQAALRAGGPLADAPGPRREGPDGRERPSGERGAPIVAQRLGDAGSEGGSPEPRLGPAADGLPRWLARWPAGPSEAQHAWEAPRTITGAHPNRPDKLRSLGNAVVPQVIAQVVGPVVMRIARSELG